MDAFVAIFAIFEARTGFNVFNHLSGFIPFLHSGPAARFLRFGSARLRVSAPAQHPIALSAAFVMLFPLAIYWRAHAQRRWWARALVLVLALAHRLADRAS